MNIAAAQKAVEKNKRPEIGMKKAALIFKRPKC